MPRSEGRLQGHNRAGTGRVVSFEQNLVHVQLLLHSAAGRLTATLNAIREMINQSFMSNILYRLVRNAITIRNAVPSQRLGFGHRLQWRMDNHITVRG